MHTIETPSLFQGRFAPTHILGSSGARQRRACFCRLCFRVHTRTQLTLYGANGGFAPFENLILLSCFWVVCAGRSPGALLPIPHRQRLILPRLVLPRSWLCHPCPFSPLPRCSPHHPQPARRLRQRPHRRAHRAVPRPIHLRAAPRAPGNHLRSIHNRFVSHLLPFPFAPLRSSSPSYQRQFRQHLPRVTQLFTEL